MSQEKISARRKSRGGHGAARIEDVARKAGVAPITVSRALRTPAKVSPEVLLRVREAVAAVGYVPNRVAGSLASNRTTLVAALVPNIGNPLFAMTLRGLSDVLRRSNFHLMVASSNHDPQEEEELLRTLLGQRPCGLVLHETLHTPAARLLLAQSGVPIVETGDLADHPLDLVVSYSNYEAARAAVRHLGSRGYRRIAFVGSKLSARSDQRRRGAEAGLAELGLPIDEARFIEVVSEAAGGVHALDILLAGDPRPEAILFTGHAAAIGAVLESQRRGLRIPEQLAFATFDETDFATSLNPALTTVRLPRYEVGRQAAELLIRRLGGEPTTSPRIDLGFQVVHRGTT